MENMYLEDLSDIELVNIHGGAKHPVLEIVAGVALVGIAIAVEFGSFGTLSIPAGYFAAAGSGMVLHGAHDL